MKKRTGILLTFLFITTVSYGQLKDIARLRKSLPLITDSTRYVDALNRLGMLLYEKSVDSSFHYARRARAIAVRLNYTQGNADALNNLGIVYDMKGNLQLSLRYYNDAYNKYVAIHDSANAVQGLMNIGLVFNETREDKKAVTFFKKAIDEGKNISKDSILSLVYCNYLLLYPDKLSKDSTKILLAKAKEIAIRYHDQRVLIVIDQIQANQYIKNGERDKGMALLQKAAEEGIAMDLNYLTLDIINTLGDVFMTTDTAKGISYYKQGLYMAEVTGYHYYEKIFGKKLYDIYIAQNSLTQVKLYGAKLLKLYDDEEHFTNTSGFDYIDYALKDQQLEALTIRSDNRKILVFVFGILFVLTAVTVAIIYRLYRLKKKHTETLEELNKSVQQRNQKLETDHEFNNRLVSILAHDFRQPLGTLKTLANVLKDADSFTHEELLALVDTMEQSSNNSLEIFENILQWIKQQLSGFSYQPQPLPLKELIDEALQPFYLIAEECGLIFINNVDASTTIYADKELVQFIHRNFIHNAIKFSPNNASITIIGSTDDEGTTVCVQDEGKGISPDKISSIFNFKVDLRYSNEKEKGAGVALMICNDFTEKMNGRIWVENAKPKGAKFCYELPNLQKPRKPLFKIGLNPILSK